MKTIFYFIFIFGVHQFTALAEPVPDIKVNGSDGPVSVSTVEMLSVTVELQALDWRGVNSDWWCVAQTPFAPPENWYHYNAAQGVWLQGLSVSFQGALADVSSPFEVLEMSGLPSGDYIFYFGVDNSMNAVWDGEQYYDSVEVDLTKPPKTPVGLNTKAISSSIVELSWNASMDDFQIAGYHIYRDGQYIDTTMSTSFNDENLNPGTEYCYAVSAYDSSDNESGTSIASCSTTWPLNCLVIGDSIGEATHTNDACDRSLGDHRELMDCIDLRLGSHDLNWSFMGGKKSWSIANRLECNAVNNRSHDGDEWKDALDRTWNQIQPGKVGNVILQLGSNDVCAEYGHDYGSFAFVQPTTPDNIVSIEAEHFIQRISGSTHEWERDRKFGASITAVRAQPDSGTNMPYPDYLTLSPRLDYRVNFVRTGIHYVWLRGYASGTDDCLVHVGLDGQRQSTAENIKIENFNQWIWSGISENGAYAMINVPFTGIHTINVYMHQDGFRLDKIALATDTLWVPLHEGPSESARGIIKQADQSGYELVDD